MGLKKIAFRSYKLINSFPFNNRLRLRGIKYENKGKLLIGCKIINKGKGNRIIFEKGGRLKNTRIFISGNDNSIIIGKDSSVLDGELYIEDNGGRISIGEKTYMCGKIHLACIEGCSIDIGNDCLFSSDIVFRTGDSHSVLDMDGKRINPSKDIKIDDHVWFGHRAMVTKGVHIASNNIIGTGALVTKSIENSNCAIAGVPAKVIKKDVNWCSERI